MYITREYDRLKTAILCLPTALTFEKHTEYFQRMYMYVYVFRMILRICSSHFLEQNYRLSFVRHLQYFMKESY
jgi:hypothetical protein